MKVKMKRILIWLNLLVILMSAISPVCFAEEDLDVDSKESYIQETSYWDSLGDDAIRNSCRHNCRCFYDCT